MNQLDMIVHLSEERNYYDTLQLCNQYEQRTSQIIATKEPVFSNVGFSQINQNLVLSKKLELQTQQFKEGVHVAGNEIYVIF